MGGLKALWRHDSDEMLWGEVGWDGRCGQRGESIREHGWVRCRGWQKGAMLRFGFLILPDLSLGNKGGPRLGVRN